MLQQMEHEQWFFYNVIFYIVNSFILSLLTTPYFLFNAPPILLEAATTPMIRSSAHKGAVPPTLRNTDDPGQKLWEKIDFLQPKE